MLKRKRLKSEVIRLLQEGCEAELAELVVARSGSLPHLVGRLWDRSPIVQQSAARVMAVVASAHPDVGREIVRRLLWALNEESATNGVYGLAGLREIGRREPSLLASCVPALVEMAEDSGLRADLLRTLAAVAESAPQLVEPHHEALQRFVDHTADIEREAFELLESALSGAPEDAN